MDDALKQCLVRVEVWVASPTEFSSGGTEILGPQRKVIVYIESASSIIQAASGRERTNQGTLLISEGKVEDDERLWPPGSDRGSENESIPIKSVESFRDVVNPKIVDHYEFRI